MGYSAIAKRRTVQTMPVVVGGLRGDDTASTCDAPVYGVLFTLVISFGTCLLGYVFFVYKWFSCLNYVIGRKLFKASVLTGVWIALIGAGVWAMLNWSFWFLFVMYLGHVALAAYLLCQLKRSRACSPATCVRLKWYSRALVTLWCLGAIWILFGWIGALHWFLLAELCLIQKAFNLVVYDASEDRTRVDAKIAADWRRLRLVVVWAAIALSILLFLWDVGATVAHVFGMKSGTYHGFALDGRFHFWLFFETYSPHAAWQLYLWCLAALMIVIRPDVLKVCRDALTGTFNRQSLGAAFTALFPSISDKQETEV